MDNYITKEQALKLFEQGYKGRMYATIDGGIYKGQITRVYEAECFDKYPVKDIKATNMTAMDLISQA